MPRPSKSFAFSEALRFVIAHPYQIIILICLLTLLFALRLPQLRFRTSIYDLAIRNLPETAYYQAFKKEFGSAEIIYVVVGAGDIFEPETFRRIAGMAREFSEIDGVRMVFSLPDIRKAMDITHRWTLRDFEKAAAPIDLFEKNFISPDKKTTVISVVLKDNEQQEKVIDAIRDTIGREGKGLSVYQIGMPLVSRALASYTRNDFLRLPPLTLAVIAFVLFYLFRSFKGILIPLSSVIASLICTFGLMAWTGTPLSMLTMIVPVFLIAVGTAYCMHIIYAHRGLIGKAGSSSEAAYLCFVQVGFPTSLAVLTTVAGLASLLMNKINGIREFALFSCFGMLSLLILMLTLIPAVLSILPLTDKDAQIRSQGAGFLKGFLQWVARINLYHQRTTLFIISATSLAAIGGIFLIRVETNPVDYFKKDTPISRHFHDIYKDMAGSFPVHVVIDGKVEGFFEDPSRLREVDRVQSFLGSLEGVDKTISFNDFLKLVNYATNKYNKDHYALPEERFEIRMLINSYKSMLGEDMLNRFVNPDFSKTNLLLRTHLSSSRDFLALKARINEYLRKNFSHDFDFHTTGFGTVMAQSSHLLTRGQIKSLSLTLILIFGIMILLFLSGKVGLIAILPNCFPIIIGLGVMGWLGIKLSVATSLIASIAIGLAVDDTIHYLVGYNREFKKDLDKDRALRDTVKGVGKPIISTTLTISLGFSILMFSHFEPTSVFGLLMVIIMISALVGDLFILPSLMRHVELVTAWDLLKLMPALGGMPAGFAHELNQPLNAIKMGSEFLKMLIRQGRRVPEENLSQVANEISNQVDRAAQIINRLRVFGRKPDLERVEIDINSPIRETIAVLGFQLNLEDIEVKLDLDETLPPILAHDSRLGQVIFNLLTNAREAIDEKRKGGEGSTHQVITIRTSGDADSITLTVSDSGVGIPKQTRGRIFEPFFSTKEQGKGRGLGLSITHEIVRDFGGSIEVRSREGGGTQFKLTFPPASH